MFWVKLSTLPLTGGCFSGWRSGCLKDCPIPVFDLSSVSLSSAFEADEGLVEEAFLDGTTSWKKRNRLSYVPEARSHSTTRRDEPSLFDSRRCHLLSLIRRKEGIESLKASTRKELIFSTSTFLWDREGRTWSFIEEVPPMTTTIGILLSLSLFPAKAMKESSA